MLEYFLRAQRLYVPFSDTPLLQICFFDKLVSYNISTPLTWLPIERSIQWHKESMIHLLFYIFHVHLKLRIRFSRKCYIWTYNLCALYSRYTESMFVTVPQQLIYIHYKLPDYAFHHIHVLCWDQNRVWTHLRLSKCWRDVFLIMSWYVKLWIFGIILYYNK